jgi:hypothetical protein
MPDSTYFFLLFLPKLGKSKEEIATSPKHLILLSEPVERKERRKKWLKEELLGLPLGFECRQFDYRAIASCQGMSLENAVKLFRHVELNSVDQNEGIQIRIYDDEAVVTIPSWHNDASLRAVFADIWNCLLILEREGGFFTYDPQLEMCIDLAKGFERSMERYQIKDY